MNKKIIFTLAALGILAGIITAFVLGLEHKPQAPLFNPVSSPFPSAIYATGIIESEQGAGSNINIYPDVSGKITQILVTEGQNVTAGDTLFTIDDTVQRATVKQLQFQVLAAQATLAELKAQPRPEILNIAKAQVDLALATLQNTRNQYLKRQSAFDLNPKSISKDILDTARDAMKQAQSALDVARKQYELTLAGAWSYEIESQQRTSEALEQAYQASLALLEKYKILAQTDGVILAINASTGSYASPLGTYDTYSQASNPLVVMSTTQTEMAVRCYIDEILLSRLPATEHINAVMILRGGDQSKIALEFVRIQPYVSPKIELSNQRK